MSLQVSPLSLYPLSLSLSLSSFSLSSLSLPSLFLFSLSPLSFSSLLSLSPPLSFLFSLSPLSLICITLRFEIQLELAFHACAFWRALMKYISEVRLSPVLSLYPLSNLPSFINPSLFILPLSPYPPLYIRNKGKVGRPRLRSELTTRKFARNERCDRRVGVSGSRSIICSSAAHHKVHLSPCL